MGGLMGDDPLQHRGAVEFVDQAVVQKDGIVAHDKGVERAVVHDEDFDSIGIEPCGTHHGRADLFERMFHIRIAQQADGMGGQGQKGGQEQGRY